MKALALQEKSDHAPVHKHQKAPSSPVPVLSPFVLPTATSGPLIQRKAGCACGGGCPSCEQEANKLNVQTKLAVSSPGDHFEQEADHVADQVMRMPDSKVQRQASGRPEASSNAAAEPLIKRQVNGAAGGSRVASDFTSRLGAGAPLDKTSRSYFEPRFGRDFSGVRIHDGPEAASAAASIQARAFTLGSDVVFAAGEHNPGSEGGKRLLAHELTHVVQQGSQPSSKIHRQQAGGISCPTSVAMSRYSRGNDDWRECDYETATMTVNLLLDTCACNLGSTMPLSLSYSAVLEGKSFTGRQIPNPSGSGTIAEREGQASHIATGIATPGRSRMGGPQTGLALSESGLAAGTTNRSGTLQLITDDAAAGGRPGDPGDIVSQQLTLLNTVPCGGGSRTGQATLANAAVGTFQTVHYQISADRSGPLAASVTLTEDPMANRVPTPIRDITPGRSSAVAPYGRFPGTPRPGGTGCTCNAINGAQVGTCNRGTGGSGVGR